MEKHRLTRPQITPAVAWGNSHFRLLGRAELRLFQQREQNGDGSISMATKAMTTIKTGGFMRVSIKVV